MLANINSRPLKQTTCSGAICPGVLRVKPAVETALIVIFGVTNLVRYRPQMFANVQNNAT